MPSSLKTRTELLNADVVFKAQPYVEVPAKDSIDLLTADVAFQAQPFVTPFPVEIGPDTDHPTVVSTNPASAAVRVGLLPVLKAVFSEPIDEATLIAANFYVTGATGTVTYKASTRQAILTITSALNYTTEYTATLTTDIQDVAGNAMEADYTWSFTTRDEFNPSMVISYLRNLLAGGQRPC